MRQPELPLWEKPIRGESGRATLEWEHLAEFIDLLVKKGCSGSNSN